MATEQDIENNFIATLTDLKYIHRKDIRDRETLEKNFREKFEELNKVQLTDAEFTRLMEQIINLDVFTSSRRLRQRSSFEREDGTPLHYTLVNIKDWCKNTFEVVNQLRINTQNSHHRYDVLLLINGVPVVQIELKSFEVSSRKAMQQIVHYKNSIGSGYSNTLLCFMQIFIVSNFSDTWYFSNNNSDHFNFDADERFLPVYRFAEKDNTKIVNLNKFAEQFLKKCTLSEMINRYMVLVASEKKLVIMRSYQIYAVKNIVDCIDQNRGNGYIWHTTGSGKTLTSFKAATLLKDKPDIKKCIFVVDRKDLDRQTRQEFNKFQEGCVEENTNTSTLVRRLLSEDYADKVIVTTIQKLGLALSEKNRRNYQELLTPLSDKRIVFIFDECHRSQFGKNHQAIVEFFPDAQLFGFTGTPIFEQNATSTDIEGEKSSVKTTKDIFQSELHTYTITDAIEDGNVLRFHIDYFKEKNNESQKAEPSVLKNAVIEAILEKHNKATTDCMFNAIFATASINDAIEYQCLFKKIQAQKQIEDISYKLLNIACVFSPPSTDMPDVKQLQEDLPQERHDNKQDPAKKKKALEEIIEDYNEHYKTNHDINNFDLYYQDVQKRIKDQQYPNNDLKRNEKIDLVIVVDMLLTGFDSKYLNTLYVDKNLKHHGLIQAFSRTNRVLNSNKPYGNIINFRRQENDVDEAIRLFSGEDTEKAKEIWLVASAPNIIGEFQEAVDRLNTFMKSEGLESTPEQVANIKGDEARRQFVNVFKEVQRLQRQLDQYTDLTPENKTEIQQILSYNTLQKFRGAYLDIARRMRTPGPESESSDLQQNIDFEYVLFSSVIIDYDYIMNLIARYTQAEPEKQEKTREELIGIIKSDAKFIDEHDDIVAYIDTLEIGKGMTTDEIHENYETFKAAQFARPLAQFAEKYKIDTTALQGFVNGIMGRLIFDGDGLSDLFAPQGLGWKARTEKEWALMNELGPLLRKQAQGQDISGLSAYET